MKGIDAVAKILQIEGVEYLFSYPNHPLIEACAKIGIRPIIARSEKTLINIADGYTRALNGSRPTVVVVQGGPGPLARPRLGRGFSGSHSRGAWRVGDIGRGTAATGRFPRSGRRCA